MPKTDKKYQRYKRQIALENFGSRGQRKLLKSKIAIVGLGGIGSMCLSILVGAGVGEIRIIDFAKVSLSSLQTQMFYRESDIGKKKIFEAERHLNKLNSEVKIVPFDIRIVSPLDMKEPLKGIDLCIETTNSIKTRLAISEACKQKKIPLITASATGYIAQVAFFGGNFYPDFLVSEIPSKRNRSKSSIPVFSPTVVQGGISAAVETLRYLVSEDKIFPAGKSCTVDFSTFPSKMRDFNIAR